MCTLELADLDTAELAIPPHDAPELGLFRDMIREFTREWTSLQGGIAASSSVRNLTVDVKGKSPLDILKMACNDIECELYYKYHFLFGNYQSPFKRRICSGPNTGRIKGRFAVFNYLNSGAQLRYLP